MSDTPSQISQIQEIFGTTELEAEKALDTYGSLNSAVQGLANPSAQSSRPEGEIMTYGPVCRRDGGDGSTQSAPAVIDRATGTTTTDPIDLTHDEQDEALQRALALSMQDVHQGSSHVSQEDRDLSRALEASIQENKRQHSYPSRLADPLNPNDRRRVPGHGVGLKNIGNTCWFSAVIQSLFHLPKFRECLLNFQAPSAAASSNGQVPRSVEFVVELQKLFALLLSSNQKFINPKRAIELLRSVFVQGPDTQQEDVSEFTHKLLEWIEDAFTSSLPDGTVNPIIELFTGECVTEGVINDQPFVNDSKFGAFPVQVEGNADLHDSLEAATVSREMQQETWFSRLPPVLVFGLSRFKFNQTIQQAEKIHDHLSFDQLLYLDRYLHTNKETSRRCRTEVARLRTEISELKRQLESYTHYGGQHISISEILSLTLQFAGCVGMETETQGTENRTKPAPRSGSVAAVDNVKTCLHQWAKEVETETSALKDKLSACQARLDAVYDIPEMKNVAYRLHAVLVHQGQASGGHYWAYVKKTPQTTGLSPDNKSKQKEESEETSSQEMMSQSPSQLAETPPDPPLSSKEDEEDEAMQQDVLQASTASSNLTEPVTAAQSYACHGGQADVASSGSNDVWLKFNDISVQEVGWEEVKRESFGCNKQTSNGNTSAYCLLYISTSSEQSWENTDPVSLLTHALLRYVHQSNSQFEDEVKAYNEKRIASASRPRDLSFIKPAKSVRFAEQDDYDAIDDEMEALPSEAKRARSNSPSPERMQVDSVLPAVEIDEVVIAELDARVSHRHHQLTEDLPDVFDCRLLSELHYAKHCGAREDIINALILQELASKLAHEDNFTLSALARRELMLLLRQPNVDKELRTIHSLFNIFSCLCYHLVQTANCFRKRKLINALPHAIQCYYLNSKIIEKCGETYAFSRHLLGQARAHTLLEASCIGTESFRAGEVKKGLDIGNDFIVSSMKAFTRYEYQGDDRVLEQVREEWCKCLDQNALTEEDSDLLADLLMKIMEEYTKAPDMIIPETPQSFDLAKLSAQLFNAVSTICRELNMDISTLSAAV